jgi:hypothetical protein
VWCSLNYCQASGQPDDLFLPCGTLGVFFCNMHHVKYTRHVQHYKSFVKL